MSYLLTYGDHGGYDVMDFRGRVGKVGCETIKIIDIIKLCGPDDDDDDDGGNF